MEFGILKDIKAGTGKMHLTELWEMGYSIKSLDEKKFI